MGYEMNRLMAQMGVASPTVGSLPEGATDAGRAAYDQYRQQYLSRVANTPQYLQSQFNTATASVPPVMTHSPAQRFAMRPGGAGIEGVNRSIQGYFGAYPMASRADVDLVKGQWGWTEPDIRNAMGARFEYGDGIAGTAGTSQALRHAQQPGRGGLAQVQQSIRDALAANPNATDAQIAAAQQATGISNRDIYNTTGNYWGNVLRPPTIAVAPPVPVQTARTPETLATYYRSGVDAGMSEAEMVNRLRAQGVTDAQMNETRNNLLGVPAGTSWADANRLAAERGQTGAVAPTTTLPAVTVAPPASTSTSGLADYYRNAAASGLNEAQIVNQLRAQGVTDAQMMDARNSLLGIPSATQQQTTTGYTEPPSGYARGGGVRALAQKYAYGGSVEDDGRREFATELSLGADDPQRVLPRSVAPVDESALEQTPARPTPQQIEREVVASPAAQPLAVATPSGTPATPSSMSLESMIQRYMGQESPYAPELRAARERAAQETAQFEKLLLGMAQRERPAPDKAELYFRLAAAFGSPTKTGHFAESLGAVGREMGAYQAEQRKTRTEDEALRRQLLLEVGKSRMGAAREDVAALRGLAGEEMKDRRALLTEYLKSGRPQSEAGKAAADMGLTPGTEQYNKFVGDYIERKLSSGEMFKQAQLAIAQGNLGIAQAGLGIKQAAEQRAAETAAKLSPTETKMLDEGMQTLGGLRDSMSALSRAFELNPKTFDGTWTGIAQQKIAEQLSPEDPRVLATREQRNLLGRGAIEKLRASFGGNPTEGERAALMDLEGLDSKSKSERAQIMANTYRLLKAREAREAERVNRIKSGQFRTATPAAAEGEQ